MSLQDSIFGVFRRGAKPPEPDAAIATDPSRLQAWIVAWIAAKTKIEPGAVDPGKLFTDFGLDSLLAVSLSGALEELVSRRLSPSIAWEYPTIAELAHYLAAGGSGSEDDMDLEAAPA